MKLRRLDILFRVQRVAWLVLMSAAAAVGADEDASRYDRRLVYTQMNLQVAESADALIELIGRAQRAGYTGVVLADYKLNILDRVPQHYFANVARVKSAADSAGIELIPAIFPIGYSAGLLAHDPNLAEGLPVVDAPFVVRGREVILQPPTEPQLVNGGFEDAVGDRFAGFTFQDDPGKATFADRSTVRGGSHSLRIAGRSEGGNRRIMQRVPVRPFACYRISAWVKTRELASPNAFRLLAIGAGNDAKPLTFLEGGVESTQDWERVDVVFNSLDNAAVNLYAGTWGDGPGTLWIDDLQLEELALVNVLRRDGCPLSMTSEDGAITYEEGRDFEPVADPRLGQVPYAGEYSFDHEGPALRLTAGSRIRDGQALRVSWYHPVLIHGSQVCSCLTEPRLFEILSDQARRVRDLLNPRAYFMSHDELRVANWCRSCRSRDASAGELLAENVRRCIQILEAEAPDAEVLVWSDMFDPHHNAVDDYYLVRNTLAGSWEGLTPEIIVANWNGDRARESLGFFADRGHHQFLAGYYDSGDLSGFTRWDMAARGVPGVVGFMYTTWQRDYDRLEAYGDAMARE